MNVVMWVRSNALMIVLCLGLASPAFGGTVEAGDASTSWLGKGQLYRVGTDRMLFDGVVEGVMFIRHYKGARRGPIHAAKLKCPVLINMDHNTKERTSSGFCVASAHGGQDVAYAEFRCSGSSEECDGEFTWIGGEGGFKGISGTSTFRSRMDFGAEDSGSITGFAVWPNLTYDLPGK